MFIRKSGYELLVASRERFDSLNQTEREQVCCILGLPCSDPSDVDKEKVNSEIDLQDELISDFVTQAISLVDSDKLDDLNYLLIELVNRKKSPFLLASVSGSAQHLVRRKFPAGL